MRTTGSLTFFFTASDVLSNWHPSPFTFRGHQFQCVEQFMMYSKAKLFGDEDIANRILDSKDPKLQKSLGRKVKNFNEGTWNQKRQNIVTVACREKFLQNPSLLQVLLTTGDTTLVEASPYDRIWGIGLSMDDPRALDQSKWLGENLLGKALMVVREQLALKAEQQPKEQGSQLNMKRTV